MIETCKNCLYRTNCIYQKPLASFCDNKCLIKRKDEFKYSDAKIYMYLVSTINKKKQRIPIFYWGDNITLKMANVLKGVAKDFANIFCIEIKPIPGTTEVFFTVYYWSNEKIKTNILTFIF